MITSTSRVGTGVEPGPSALNREELKMCNAPLTGRGHGRTCAREMGHAGRHRSAEALAVNLKRDRGPGICGVRGCDQPKHRFSTGNYNITCREHELEWNQDPRRLAGKRNAELKRLYGITSEQYDQMLSDQNGMCAICGGEPNGRGNYFHVDHDHETGEVRGLLCHNCNIAIGLLKHDPTALKRAVTYLEEM